VDLIRLVTWRIYLFPEVKATHGGLQNVYGVDLVWSLFPDLLLVSCVAEISMASACFPLIGIFANCPPVSGENDQNNPLYLSEARKLTY
jgi:hypothetical protein